MKTCHRCKVNKDLKEYFNDKYTIDGKAPSCKTCVYKRRLEPKKVVPVGHKRCNGCMLAKPYNEFYADKANKTDGRYSHCIKCKDESTKKWREENAEYYNKYMREYHKKVYGTERLYRYNLSRERYNEMLREQDNKCAILGCGRTATSKRSLAIDHHHASGKVRGLLCYKCNRDMNVIDNAEHLAKLLEYKRRTETE